jgi:putative phosphoesterase
VIVGILSDTHGRIAPTTAALAVLRRANAEFFIHCGDVGGEPIFDLLAGLPLAFVWGNTDFDREHLTRYAKNLGLACHGDLADLDLGRRRFAVTHGDQPQILKQIIAAKHFKYLLHGHTHVARDQTIHGIRCINPGAVHRSPRPTVAVLNTESEELKFLPIAEHPGD